MLCVIVTYYETLGIKKPRKDFQGNISLTTLLESPKKVVKRKPKDNLQKDITKKKVKKMIKDSLRKDTTNKNVNRESNSRLKKGYSQAHANEVVTNPKPPTAIGPYTSMSTGGVGMHRESQYWQPVQQGYSAAAPVHLGASAGYQG